MNGFVLYRNLHRTVEVLYLIFMSPCRKIIGTTETGIRIALRVIRFPKLNHFAAGVSLQIGR